VAWRIAVVATIRNAFLLPVDRPADGLSRPDHKSRKTTTEPINAERRISSGADVALLLIWAFIAGFSERLVPDLLSRLAKKAE